MGTQKDETPRQPNSFDKRLTTIFAADICNFSGLAETNDDIAVKVVGIVFSIFEKIVEAHQGRIFNCAGDGFFAEFSTATNGLCAARAFIKELNARDTLSPTSIKATARVGLHIGEVTPQENGDLLGHGVNIASRLQSHADPNEIIFSAQILNLVQDRENIAFRKLGNLSLKNIEAPIAAFAIKQNQKSSPLFKIRAKKIQRVLLRPIPIFIGLAILLLTNNFLLDLSLKRQETSQSLAEAQSQIKQLQSQVQQLTKNISDAQPDADEKQILLIREVAESLAASTLPEKINIKDLIENGRLDDGISLLYNLFKMQIEQNMPPDHISVTARELGALAFYSNKTAATKAYEWLWENSGQSDIQSLMRSADLYIVSSQLTKARDAYQFIYNNNNDEQLRTQARIGLGRYYLRAEQSNDHHADGTKPASKAEAFFLEALATSTKNKFFIEKIRSLLFLSTHNYFNHNLDQALTYAQEALMTEKALPSTQQNERRQARIYFTIGNILSEIGQTGKALANFQNSFHVAEKINDKESMVSALINKSHAYEKDQNIIAAEKTLNQALDIAQTETMDNKKAIIYRTLANFALADKDTSKACNMLDKWKTYHIRSDHTIDDKTNSIINENCLL